MRLFIAIEFPRHIREGLLTWQDALRQVSRARFPGEEHFHLTLHFLGEVAVGRIDDIVHSLQQASRQCSPFALSFGRQLYCFGPSRLLRVVWLGLAGDLTQLLQLQRTIVATMNLAIDDRPAYNPHITLARDVHLLRPDMLQGDKLAGVLRPCCPQSG